MLRDIGGAADSDQAKLTKRIDMLIYLCSVQYPMCTASVSPAQLLPLREADSEASHASGIQCGDVNVPS
jgi:hypothetical protein